MNKHILSCLMLAALSVSAAAQSGTNSPYSQFGLGVLADQSQGFNRGMNGVGLGLRYGNRTNTLNPASYSAIDSLTMIFDVGLSGQITNFKEGGKKVNAHNADFEYATGTFRAAKNVGVSFGLLPFTNVGYNYSSSGYADADKLTTYTNTYTGSGGFHEAFIGAGWRVTKPLSVGVNIGYLWGEYNKSVVNSYSDTYVDRLSKVYSATVNSYKLDFGVQWEQPVAKEDKLTVGVTYGLGHKLGADPSFKIQKYNQATGWENTHSYTVDNGLALPTSFGAGVSYSHQDRWVLAADYTMQRWGSVDYPVLTENSGNMVYQLQSGVLSNRNKINIGGEWTPNIASRNLIKRIRYRAGVSYATPYIKVNGNDGPKEMAVSAGFGIPIVNSYNNRSILNISGQWVHSSAKNLITENTFRINIGITFNERWFAKWKVQ